MNRGLFGLPPRKQSYPAYDPFAPPVNDAALSDMFAVEGSGLPAGWANAGALTPTIARNRGRLLFATTAAGGADMAAIERTMPVSPFTVVVHCTLTGRVNFNLCGPYVRSATSGLIVANRIFRNNTDFFETWVNAEKFTSFTSRTGFLGQFRTLENSLWMSIRFDGSTLFYEFSLDGVNFVLQTSESAAGYFGANLPDRMGLCVGSFSANAPAASFRSFRYFPFSTNDIGRLIAREVEP